MCIKKIIIIFKMEILSKSDFNAKGELSNKKYLDKKKSKYPIYTTIMFFADWCGHCQEAKPIYINVCSTGKCLPNVFITGVDCTNNTEIQKYITESNPNINIRGYPTFIQYKNGNYHRTFEGKRDGIRMSRFVSGIDKY